MVETDELIRSKLDRRNRVLTMRERNEMDLSKSQRNLEKSRSPTRF